MVHREYTEDDKATALATLQANNGNILRTANELGIPQSTLRKWRAGEGINRAVAPKCEHKKEELGDLFERVSRLYLDHAIADTTLRKVKGKDAVVAAAVAAEKMRLCREQSTSIPGRELTDDERERELRELALRIRERRRELARPAGQITLSPLLDAAHPPDMGTLPESPPRNGIPQ